MSRGSIFAVTPAATVAAFLLFHFAVAGEPAQAAPQRHPRITERVDESRLVTLEGNTRPEAIAENDRGPVPADFPLEHMLLQLKRSPESEQALEQYITGLSDRSSPDFHRWLTADEFGQTYGVDEADLTTLTNWLESGDFTVNLVYPNRMVIDFSGTAGQVRTAFHAEIHYLDVDGARHFANMSDPRIPAALAPIVVGIVSLHDFLPYPMYKPRADYTFTSGTPPTTTYAVVPGDLETIYNLNPLFSEGYSGQGQTVVVIEDSDEYNPTMASPPPDWATFRSTFALSKYTAGSFTLVHPAPPTGANNCSDPGANGDDGEAILDAEYASAAAPSAAIEMASCANAATYGPLIALQNLLKETAMPPAIMSISYGLCEAENGAAANAAFNSAYQQAAAEGVSVFVSSGDEGAASCDANQTHASHGIGVSGWASTPYNVAVGGTDFGDTAANKNATYWDTTNISDFASAKSYIPEIPWNDSCASVVLATYLGDATTYGSGGSCNTSPGDAFLSTTSGSGGPSGCASGAPTTGGVVSGTCAPYPKPTWQSLVGNPGDGVRDIPDVSLFAANGVWGHYYVFCWSDPSQSMVGSAPCTGAPSTWSGGGGTSFSSPIMAGIQALVNQKWSSRQGNPNPIYYQIARSEYGGSGNSACNSSNPPLPRGLQSACVFYDVTQGDMDVNCTALRGTLFDCYRPSGTNGVLSSSDTTYDIAFGTTIGWDFATGIGTVNAYNLVSNAAWSP